MTRLAVFAYGSLVDPSSASLTLGREISSPLPARLRGWRRRWSVCRDNRTAEKTFAARPGGEVPPWIIGLNVEPAGPGQAGPVGALLEVSAAELDRLDVREARYGRADMTENVVPIGAGAHPFDRVIGFTARPEHHAPVPPPGAVIIAAYVRAVEAAFDAAGLLAEFHETTEPPPVPVVEGELLAGDSIPAGNPRTW